MRARKMKIEYKEFDKDDHGAGRVASVPLAFHSVFHSERLMKVFLSQ